MNACTTSRAVRSSARLLRLVSVLPVLFLPTMACSDLLTMPTNQAVTFWIVSGNHQAAEVGTELSAPLVVIVVDRKGVPVKGVDVHFQGDGQAVRTQARTNDQGHAWAYWQLGPRVGAQVMRATAIAPNQPVVLFASEGVVGPAATISVETSTNSIVSPGTELDTLTVTVRDQYANPVIGTPVNWTVQQGAGSVRPLSALTGLGGRASAIWTLGPAIGVHRLAVTSGVVSRQFTATAAPVFVVAQVVTGSDHTCALTADGSPFCWGSNWTGQLGRGQSDYENNTYPLPIPGYRFKALATGGIHTCGLTQDGVTFCWGSNRAGQVGIGQTARDDVVIPTRVTGAPAFVALTAGWFHTCGMTAGGEVYCWGDNSVGQLGRGTDRSQIATAYLLSQPRPELVAGSLRFTSISSSPSATSTCGVADGAVYCWGESAQGVLGRVVQQQCRLQVTDYYYGVYEYDVPCSTAPVRVSTRTAAASVVLERHAACAILTTAELECWGYDFAPALVTAAKVTNAWVLPTTVCGEADTGQVTCWRLLPPYSVQNPFGAVGALINLHSSGRHSCGIAKATSGLYCWGSNFDGALGDGTTRQRNVPTPVVSPLPVGFTSR